MRVPLPIRALIVVAVIPLVAACDYICSTKKSDGAANVSESQDTGSVTGGDTGSITGGDTGSITGGDTGSITGGDTGSITGGDAAATSSGSGRRPRSDVVTFVRGTPRGAVVIIRRSGGRRVDTLRLNGSKVTLTIR